MNTEIFDRLVGKLELYKLLNEGLNDLRNNRVLPAEEAFRQIEDEFKGDSHES